MTSTPTLQSFTTGTGNFSFSALPVDELGADSYTLVGIANDVSGSVARYVQEMTDCLKTILNSCKKHPRSENLMLRLSGFGSDVHEMHGFRELETIDESEYDNIIRINGMTALNDGIFEMVETVRDYARVLSNSEFLANAIVFVVTDGFENASKHSMQAVQDLINQVIRDEVLESIQVVLIGITEGQDDLNQQLEDFQKNVGIHKYININNASASSLAKLAEWISKSVSSTSQALGTGNSSSLLEF